MAEEQNKMLYDETQLPRECLTHSEQHLGETTAKREEKLRELISWLDKTSHIKLNKHNNVWLLYFLRATKFRVEKAKVKISRLVLFIFFFIKNNRSKKKNLKVC